MPAGLGRCLVRQPHYQNDCRTPRQPIWRQWNEGVVDGAMRSISAKLCESEWIRAEIGGASMKVMGSRRIWSEGLLLNLERFQDLIGQAFGQFAWAHDFDIVLEHGRDDSFMMFYDGLWEDQSSLEGHAGWISSFFGLCDQHPMSTSQTFSFEPTQNYQSNFFHLRHKVQIIYVGSPQPKSVIIHQKLDHGHPRSHKTRTLSIHCKLLWSCRITRQRFWRQAVTTLKPWTVHNERNCKNAHSLGLYRENDFYVSPKYGQERVPNTGAVRQGSPSAKYSGQEALKRVSYVISSFAVTASS